MSALAPGLWKATVRGVTDVIVLVTDENTAYRNITIETCGGEHWHSDVQVTDARPLIVLDLDDPRRLARLMRDNGLLGLADQIIEQTKPARIKEPGLWGVVEATFLNQRTRQPFLRDNIKENVGGGWVAIYGPPGTDKRRVDWDSLIDPTLIREGLS